MTQLEMSTSQSTLLVQKISKEIIRDTPLSTARNLQYQHYFPADNPDNKYLKRMLADNPDVNIILHPNRLIPLLRNQPPALFNQKIFSKLLVEQSANYMAELCGSKEPTPHRCAALRIYLLICLGGKDGIHSPRNGTSVNNLLIPRVKLVRALTLNDSVHREVSNLGLNRLLCPKRLNRLLEDLFGLDEFDDTNCDVEEWLDFIDTLVRRKNGEELDWNAQEIDDTMLESILSRSVNAATKPKPFTAPKLKLQSKKDLKLKAKKKRQMLLLNQKKLSSPTKKASQSSLSLSSTSSSSAIVRGKAKGKEKGKGKGKGKGKYKPMVQVKSISSPTTKDDLLQWITSLKLSNAGSFANWRRSFANGYLFAEILLYHYDALYFRTPVHLRGPQIILSAFDPVVSAISKMQDNWKTLLSLLSRRLNIKLKIDSLLVLRIMKSRENAAVTLLQALYIELLKLNMVPETRNFKMETSSVSLNISVLTTQPPTTTTTTTTVPRSPAKKSQFQSVDKSKKRRGKSKHRSGSMDLTLAEVGVVGLQLGLHGEIEPVGVQTFSIEEHAIAIGKVPDYLN